MKFRDNSLWVILLVPLTILAIMSCDAPPDFPDDTSSDTDSDTDADSDSDSDSDDDSDSDSDTDTDYTTCGDAFECLLAGEVEMQECLTGADEEAQSLMLDLSGCMLMNGCLMSDDMEGCTIKHCSEELIACMTDS